MAIALMYLCLLEPTDWYTRVQDRTHHAASSSLIHPSTGESRLIITITIASAAASLVIVVEVMARLSVLPIHFGMLLRRDKLYHIIGGEEDTRTR